MGFIEKNHRNPSKKYDEEKRKYHWVKHTKKQLNAGFLKVEKVEKVSIVALAEENKYVNQCK